jgi:hypothetical protein
MAHPALPGANNPGVAFTDSGMAVGFSTNSGFGRPLAGPVISGAAIAVLRNLEHGSGGSAGEAWRATVARLWRLIGSQNIIGSVIFAILQPYVAIARTLLYLDIISRGEQPALAAVPVPAPAT